MPNGAQVQRAVTLTINSDGSGSFSMNPSGAGSLTIPLPAGAISKNGASLEWAGKTADGQVVAEVQIANGVITLGDIKVYDYRVGQLGSNVEFTAGQLLLT
jgi:hypothetical protein